MRLTIEPFGIVKSIALTATSPPNRRVTPFATRIGSPTGVVSRDVSTIRTLSEEMPLAAWWSLRSRDLLRDLAGLVRRFAHELVRSVVQLTPPPS